MEKSSKDKNITLRQYDQINIYRQFGVVIRNY